jgi:hypothetical protein
MMARAAKMARTEGEGERLGRERRRRIIWLVAFLVLVGGLVGGVVGYVSGHAIKDPNASIPPALAIVCAVVLVVGTLVGAIAFFRQVDELERQVNYWTANVSIYFYFLAYVCWYLLWRGNLIPEPSHEALFLSTMLVMTLAYFWKKMRP